MKNWHQNAIVKLLTNRGAYSFGNMAPASGQIGVKSFDSKGATLLRSLVLIYHKLKELMNKAYSQKQNDLAQATRQERMLNIAYNLHEIEGNPLLSIEKAMFEDFAKKGLSDEECRERIRKIATKDSTSTNPF